MPKKELHKTLLELRNELDHKQFEFKEKRGDAIQSITTLENKLQSDDFMTGDEYLVAELREALEEFEESHPRLIDLVGRIADLLNKMGI